MSRCSNAADFDTHVIWSSPSLKRLTWHVVGVEFLEVINVPIDYFIYLLCGLITKLLDCLGMSVRSYFLREKDLQKLSSLFFYISSQYVNQSWRYKVLSPPLLHSRIIIIFFCHKLLNIFHVDFGNFFYFPVQTLCKNFLPMQKNISF